MKNMNTYQEDWKTRQKVNHSRILTGNFKTKVRNWFSTFVLLRKPNFKNFSCISISWLHQNPEFYFEMYEIELVDLTAVPPSFFLCH